MTDVTRTISAGQRPKVDTNQHHCQSSTQPNLLYRAGTVWLFLKRNPIDTPPSTRVPYTHCGQQTTDIVFPAFLARAGEHERVEADAARRDSTLPALRARKKKGKTTP